MTIESAVQQVVEPAVVVVAGVDTHQRTHHVVVLDERGSRVGDRQVDNSSDGYRQLLDFVAGRGLIVRVGVESTGSYGAGLTRFLREAGVEVVEVNRPARQSRAIAGKSDPIDAESAARQVLSGVATAVPKDTTGQVEAIRVLKVARDAAVKAKTAALGQIRDLILTAPAELRASVDAPTARARVKACLGLRPDPTRAGDPAQAAKIALRSLARRVRDLETEIAELDAALTPLVARVAPTLVGLRQVGTHTAAQLLVTAGQNPDRLRSEAAFARLTGTAPLPASSGKTRRMRLSRGGDRQANRALHIIAVGRLRTDERSRQYAARRTAEGLSKKDIIRCLKRYAAREIFTAIRTDLAP